MRRNCIFLIASFFVATTLYAAPLQKIEIINAVSRKAVCNDGTPGVYYLRSGSGGGVNRWIIALEGGFWCDKPGCPGRSRSLMSSSGKPATRDAVVGLLSDSPSLNPDFYDSNMVVIVYCSSDAWSGNRRDTSVATPIEFRGRNIFRAVISDLKKKSGNNLLSPGTEVLLTGYSAGGVGVMVHLDWLAKQLPNAKVRGFNDAGWFPEESETMHPIEAEIAVAIPMWNGKADSTCDRANRTTKEKCYFSSALPYITTPLFVYESQWDSVFVLDTSQPSAKEFAKSVRDSLIPVQGAFSPRLSIHVLSDRSGFSSVKIGDVSLRDLLGNWFFDRAGKVKAIKK